MSPRSGPMYWPSTNPLLAIKYYQLAKLEVDLLKLSLQSSRLNLNQSRGRSCLKESKEELTLVAHHQPPKKRKFFDESLTDTTLKKALLESEQEKIGLLRNINNKMDKVVDLLGQIVGIQNRLLSNTTSQLHPSYLPNPTTLLPPFAPQPYPSTFMQQHFPSND